jgi:hypothetical protein
MKVPSALQFVLDLFGPAPEPVDRIQKAEPSRLQGGVPVEYSNRRRRGWRLVRENGQWVCQAPEALRQAPPEIQADLQEWIRSAARPFPGSRRRRRECERRIFAWMSPRVPDRVPRGTSQGRALDLQELFEEINGLHFEGRLRATVRWSPRLGGLSTHQELSTQEGVRHLITISRAYDGEEVPRMAVGGVLFHEMCHIAYPPRQGRGGKRMVHHKEFRVAERLYPHWVQWRDWEKAHLLKRLRKMSKDLMTSHF